MNRERWQRIEAVFQGALDRPTSARAAYLDDACVGDPSLRDEVEALLRNHDGDQAFLDPIVELAAGPGPGPGEPDRVGPYRIVREIGAGGMGVVYLAIHEGPGFERAVALKVIRRGLDTDDVLRRFQLERRILAALQHPNVAHLMDAGQTADGRPYFVMQFVEGVPIDVYCDREQLGIPHRLRLFQTVCDAVQHAHNNLVLHRDLKPGNILVGTDGAPVLLDFGIGKLIDPFESSASTATGRTGVRAFTPAYAAPEQVRGEPASAATDVYGLGLLLYRLLAGRLPFDAVTPADFEKATLETEPPRPSAMGDRRLAGDLDTIVLKALRKEPSRRYSSVAALSDDVRRHLDGMPVLARPDTFAYRAGKFARRHRLWLTAAAITFLSLVSATAYSTSQARVVARERDKAIEVQMFLLEMFGASGRERADTVSVRQLLDAQAAQVPIAYADRPELRAQMLHVIADGYDRLGLVAQAEPHAREALELRRAVLRPDHPDIAHSTSLLGWIRYERGQVKDGEALLREAHAAWPRARPANLAAQSRTINDLGVVREASGAYDEAGDLYRQALVMRRRLFGDADRTVAITGSNLSVVLYRKGDLKGAVAVAESALAVMRKAAGPDHQRSTLIQGNLASMRVAMGDFRGAEAEYGDVIARQSRVQGRQHPVTAGTIQAFANALRGQRRYAEAESLMVEVLGNLEAAFGRENARVANASMLLGNIRSSLGRFGEARPLIERALAIHRKLRGDTHRDVAQAIGALATMEGDAGNWAAAERGHRQALDVYERALGKQHVEVATARARVARAVFMRGRPDEAHALYRTAFDAMLAAGLQPSSANVRDARLRMAESLVALKRLAEADSILAAPDSLFPAAQKGLRDSLRTATATKSPR